MPQRRGTITAHQLLQELGSDAAYVSAQEARERDRASLAEQYRREEAPLLDDLAAVGVFANSVWDLVNSAEPYLPALPVLLSHLSCQYSEVLLEGITRALAVKDARFIAWNEILTMLRRQALPSRAAEGAMIALSVMAHHADIPVLIGLICDRSLGGPRIFLVRRLARFKKPEVRAALMSLQDDPELSAEIAARLKLSRS
jgi:hypothetical protein